MGQPLTEAEWAAVQSFLDRVRGGIPDQDASGTVFGSRARGEAGPDSDLDVLVVLDQDDLPTRRRVFDLAYEVFLATDVLISPLVISREGFAALKRSGRRIIRDIERDGVPLG